MRGLDLAETLYRETVGPLLAAHLPGLRHGAALVGAGSEVLGFDDETSRDHDWGPRLQLVLEPEDHARLATTLAKLLDTHLPAAVAGFPVRFARLGSETTHHVEVVTLAELVGRHLPADAVAALVEGGPVPPAAWLATPSQELLALTSGAVFRDGVGLGRVRELLAWYPRDVWLYLMAASWSALGEDEHLAPRAGQAGDDVGSRLIAARLVRSAMRLSFLQSRVYAPYAKWWGTAFSQTDTAPELSPLLAAALTGDSWSGRSRSLASALELLARRHNALELTPPVPEHSRPFHTRGFPVTDGATVARALLQQVTDPAVARLAQPRPVGGIDHVTESTDVLADPAWRARLGRLWAPDL